MDDLVKSGNQQVQETSSLHAIFARSVEQYPARPAVHLGGRTWSYRELAEQVRVIVALINRSGLAAAGRTIAVLADKGPTAYAGMLAVMASGNTFVPLNGKFPLERNLRILEDAEVATVIVDVSNLAQAEALLAHQNSTMTVLLPDHQEIPANLSTDNLHRFLVCESKNVPAPSESIADAQLQASDLAWYAYIIYTSGTTGEAKGVPVTHTSACWCIENIFGLLRTNKDDRFSQFSELSFDFSIGEIFLCWRSGGSLFVPSAADSLVPKKYVINNSITVWSSVPSLANNLGALGMLRSGEFPSLRLSVFCGEALSAHLAHSWIKAAPGTKVVNFYGPTEAAVFATYHFFDPVSETQPVIVPIGVPMEGFKIRVVDESLQPVQGDDVGELLLSGPQVSDGYWKNEKGTQAKFVRLIGSNDAEELWYKTGDLVTQSAEVGLCFRGRIDDQVKVRGYRVEISEVEATLREIAGCELVAVAPRLAADGRCEDLIGFCNFLRLSEEELKQQCSMRLPPFMVPARIIELDPFPKNTNGKTDYSKLKDLAGALP